MKNEGLILTTFTPYLKSETLSRFLDAMDEAVIETLAESFRKEGHHMTGKLIDDIHSEVDLIQGGFIINYIAKKYAAYLNFGVKASRIPYSEGSGASHSLYIEGLIKYVRLRMGIGDPRMQKSIAFAIARTQKRKGMPIRTEGKGTQWIDKTKEGVERRLTPLFSDLAEEYIAKTIRNIPRE